MIRFSLQRSTQNFEIRRPVPRVKKTKTDEIKKNTHTSLSLPLSLYLSIRRCNVYFDVPAPVPPHPPPPPTPPHPLSLSLFTFAKHGLDPDQTRMVFRIECSVNLKMRTCDRKYTKRYTVECPTLPYKSRCARYVWVLGPHRKQL